MHPVAFVTQLLGKDVAIHSYGLCLAAAVVVATALTMRACARAGIDPFRVLSALALTLGFALCGAYGLAVLVEALQTGDLLAALRRGGLVFYGGFLGGFAGFVIAARSLSLPFWRVAGLAVVPFALAHGIGRVGCFLAGCCYGTPWTGPFAARATDPAAYPPVADVSRHPVQLYEAFSLGGFALVLSLIPLWALSAPRRLPIYVLFYAAMRFALEHLRDDPERGRVLGWLSTSQLIAVVLMVLATLSLLIGSSRTTAGVSPRRPDERSL